MNGSEPFPRWLDLIAALFGLILLAPLLAGIALLILLFDGRPVCFRQWRVGKNGTMFRILKFRTMTQGRSGPQITAGNDHRITALGRWLRRLKLDEFPQLINVLKGEMSLIGPRPEVPQFVNLRQSLWRKVLQVKPGITDVASLLYRDEEHILAGVADPEDFYRRRILPRKLKLNLQYVARRSWRKDFLLLALTIRYSLFPQKFDRQKIAEIFELSRADSATARVVSTSRGERRYLGKLKSTEKSSRE